MENTSSAIGEEIQNLGEALCRSIASNRYDEAQKLVDRCLELHNAANHHVVLAIFERARRLAIVQRSLVPQFLASLKTATQYAAGPHDRKRYIASG